MLIAALQLNSQGLSSTKLYNYIRIAHKKGVKVLVLGEYILNPFFKELQNLSIDMINESSKMQIKVLKDSARDYDLTIIAPLILVKNKKPYKYIIKFSPKSTAYYLQQILINYPHWNEEKFFANPLTRLKAPLTFKKDGLKFAIMAGFELHFDKIWNFIDEKNIDAVLVPSASTFGSHQRWQALIQTRAFTHNCYILRANRIGEYKDKKASWEFYGDSILASPDGYILNTLGNEEELMIGEISKNDIIKSKKAWKFKEAILKREGENI